MKRLPIVILYLTLVLAACSHDSHVQTVLDDADRLMFSRPDSAATMLDSLDVSRASESQKARRALLLTMAQVKSHLVVTDTSRINLAVRYYSGRGDSLEMQSLFYQGVVLKYIGNNNDALLALTKAADIANDLGDNFYYGLANREQAGVYTDLYRFEQDLKARQEAVDAFMRCGRPPAGNPYPSVNSRRRIGSPLHHSPQRPRHSPLSPHCRRALPQTPHSGRLRRSL